MCAASWQQAVAEVVEGESLFAPDLTQTGVIERSGPPPRAVYLGLGLCTRHRMAVGLPLDVLGMLLPAERLRQAVGASHLLVLIADAHAEASGFPSEEVRLRARATVRALLRVKHRKSLDRLVPLLASELHADAGYRSSLERIATEAKDEGNAYMYRQTADVVYLDEKVGGILKLGWTVTPNGQAGGYRDEVAFDRVVEPWSGRKPYFAYVRCGRAFDDQRPKVSPYVGVDKGRRIYLHPSEVVSVKLGRASQLASSRNIFAVREHLGRIADAWGADKGSLDERVQGILHELYPGTPEPDIRLGGSARGETEGGLAVAVPRHC